MTKTPRAVMAFFMMGLFFTATVDAAGFTVISTKPELDNGSYRLSAELGFELSTEVNEAIQNGIPVTLSIDIEVLRQREYLWAESVMLQRHHYRLQYHALSEQYLVKNIKTGEQTFYKVLEDALYNLEHIADLPVIDDSELDPRRDYIVRLRTGINIRDLPAPLRFFAYFSPGWNLSSGWFSSPLMLNIPQGNLLQNGVSRNDDASDSVSKDDVLQDSISNDGVSDNSLTNENLSFGKEPGLMSGGNSAW